MSRRVEDIEASQRALTEAELRALEEERGEMLELASEHGRVRAALIPGLKAVRDEIDSLNRVLNRGDMVFGPGPVIESLS